MLSLFVDILNNMQNVVLALDASTSTIGISVLSYDENFKFKLLHSDYYKPDKSNGIIDMLIKARDHIKNIAIKYSITEFVIEDYVRFMKGSSTAATVIPLAILNMTLRLMIVDNFGIEPNALNVLKIRHAIKLNKELPKKEDIPLLLERHFDFKYPWFYKYNKRKKEDVIMEESYDMADAIAVSLAYVKIKEKEHLKTMKKKAKK